MTVLWKEWQSCGRNDIKYFFLKWILFSNVSPISFITFVRSLESHRYPWVSHSFKIGQIVSIWTFKCPQTDRQTNTHRPLQYWCVRTEGVWPKLSSFLGVRGQLSIIVSLSKRGRWISSSKGTFFGSCAPLKERPSQKSWTLTICARTEGVWPKLSSFLGVRGQLSIIVSLSKRGRWISSSKGTFFGSCAPLKERPVYKLMNSTKEKASSLLMSKQKSGCLSLLFLPVKFYQIKGAYTVRIGNFFMTSLSLHAHIW